MLAEEALATAQERLTLALDGNRVGVWDWNIATGTVYPVLTRLEREGRLSSRLVPSAAGPARKYYRPTPSGLGLLAESRRAWNDLSAVVARLLPDPKESR